jgi:superfamily I DNA/RNA helicase
MAKEKWLIDPGELDEFQIEIRGISLNDSYVIKGGAGSGKTILALYRANDIRIQALAEDESASPSFTMVVLTKALKSFIRSGIRDLGINIEQVIHYDKWDGSAVDYIIVDEAQDFTNVKIDVFAAAKKKSIMLYGDTQQQIYTELNDAEGGALSIEEIAKHLGLSTKELKKNYRLPKLVAAFASYLTGDKDLEKNCVKDGGEKPKLRKFNKWEKELDYIINEINTRNYTDVAILLPFNIKNSARYNNFHRNIETVSEYFDSKSFSHEVKDSDKMELDFDSTEPKILTYHSAKGLQFETVFIPFCDYPGHDDWFIKRYRNPLYVATTRTYRNLYITHSDPLTPFLNSVPASKYE